MCVIYSTPLDRRPIETNQEKPCHSQQRGHWGWCCWARVVAVTVVMAAVIVAAVIVAVVVQVAVEVAVVVMVVVVLAVGVVWVGWLIYA